LASLDSGVSGEFTQDSHSQANRKFKIAHSQRRWAGRLPDRAILFGKIPPSVGLAWGFALVLPLAGLLFVMFIVLAAATARFQRARLILS
jgi:hypothetical protein